MPFLNVRKNSIGITLIETLVIVFLVAILTAITAPSFFGLFDRIKVNNAVVEVRGALRETQREAIRRSQPCIVTLKPTQHQVTGSCLVSGDRTLPNDVAIATNIRPNSSIVNNPIQLEFGIWGTAQFTVISSVTPPDTPTDPSGKIILYIPSTPTLEKKCVAISNTLGLTRVGNYTGLTTPAEITDNGICTAT